MLPLLTRIDHVGIACRDLDQAIEVYRATFGLEVVSTEVNEAQGVREAMLQVVAGTAGAPGSYVPRWASSWLAAARASTTSDTAWPTSARPCRRSARPASG